MITYILKGHGIKKRKKERVLKYKGLKYVQDTIKDSKLTFLLTVNTASLNHNLYRKQIFPV